MACHVLHTGFVVYCFLSLTKTTRVFLDKLLTFIFGDLTVSSVMLFGYLIVACKYDGMNMVIGPGQYQSTD